MRIVKAAAVQLSPVLYSREGTVDKVALRGRRRRTAARDRLAPSSCRCRCSAARCGTGLSTAGPLVTPLMPSPILKPSARRRSALDEVVGPPVDDDARVAVQRWPVEPKAPCAVASTARSMSASSSTTTGFLPPISHCTFAPRRAALLVELEADVVRAGEGDGAHGAVFDDLVARPSAPEPMTRLRTPAGKPASAKSSTISARSRA